MRALSVRQPWAWCIVEGHKDVENRSWKTGVRGRVLIHAGWVFDDEGYAGLPARFPGLRLPRPQEFLRGGIVGSVEIADCVTASSSPWFTGPFGFVLENARTLPFIELRGERGFLEVRLEEEIP